MNSRRFKQYLNCACLLVAAACLFAACTKRAVQPGHYSYNSGGTTATDSGKTDSVASFNEPTAIALDAAGNIYVADYGNNEIREISTGGVVTTLAGNGTQGSLNTTAKNSTFNGPTGLTVDAAGNVYVADNNNNQIREISTAGTVSTIAGSDSSGAVDGVGANAYFFGPTGIVADANANLYVTDAGNNLIRKVVPSTGQVTTVAGNANTGSANGALLLATFNNPSGIAIGAPGNLYVADMLNGKVREINPATSMVSTVAGVGDTTESLNGPDSTARFYYPTGVAVDASGNIYVAEYVTNLIRKISINGMVTTFAGSGAAGQADSTGTSATFNGPSGLAIDKAGNLYVADTYNNVIRKITHAGVVSTIAGSGLAGSTDGKALSLRRRTLASGHAVIRPNTLSRKSLDRIFIKRRRKK